MPVIDTDTEFFKPGQVDNLSIGQNGAVIVTDTSATSGNFYCIHFVEGGAFSALTGENLSGTWTGVTFATNTMIFGRFSAFTLSSGKVIAYKWKD
ncbi:MAG: hypothetical protein D6698_16800 [Gammaproteobacteria bacterium]|nr:MAG: hypothetical protein D6698_16800 [Gammaproteobacteria bacterium]